MATKELSTDDAIAEWTAAQQRIIELVESVPVERLGETVPATPEWTVHDLLAHVIGLDVDVLAGDEPDDHNATWTQAQVDARRDHDVAALVAEWRAATGPLQEWMRTNGTRPLGDVIIHEQDLRGALGVPGARETAGLRAIRDRMAGRWNGLVAGAGLPPITLIGPTWRHRAGEGAPEVVVGAPDFDLVRALMSRRSESQLRSWATKGDITPYLPTFAVLGPVPSQDLVE